MAEGNDKSRKPFDVLWLTARFQKNLALFLRGKRNKKGKIKQTLEAFYEDPAILDRTPIKHNKWQTLFHTSISEGDRLVDLPHSSGSLYGALLLNIGDHTLNEWAEQFRCNPDAELAKSASRAKDKPEPTIDPNAEPLSQWCIPERAGTYGEYLREVDLNKAGVHHDLIPTVLACSRELSLDHVGLDEATADRLNTVLLNRLPAEPIPELIPAVDDPSPIELRREQVPALLRTELAKLLAQVSEEQRRLIDRPADSLVVIKGAAGSGKTVVGVRRFERSVCDEGLMEKRFLFLCYNQVLKDAVRQMLQDAIGQRSGRNVWWIRTVFEWMRFIAMHTRIDIGASFVATREILPILTKIRSERPSGIKKVDDLYDNYVLSEFAEIIYGRGIHEKDYYVDATRNPRLGRGLPLDQRERTAVWDLFEAFNADCETNGRCMYNWLAWHLLKKLPDRLDKIPAYDGIVIDEAQDLSPSVFRLVRMIQREREAGLTILGDAVQNVYGTSFRWRDTGIRVTGGHVARLRRCYRTTRQIVWVASSLIDGMQTIENDDLVVPEGIDREGPVPSIHVFSSQADEIDYVRERIFDLVTNVTPASGIAVFASTRRMLHEINTALRNDDIPTEFYEKENGSKSIHINEPSVKLITALSAKGIEFPIVFIVDVSENNYRSAGNENARELARRTLYTAMMRSAYSLSISAHGDRPSGLLKELQKALATQGNLSD